MEFRPNVKMVRLTRPPSSGGMVDVSKLRCRASSSNATMPPSSGGMAPERRLLFRMSVTMLFRLPRVAGIGPVMLALEARAKSSV